MTPEKNKVQTPVKIGLPTLTAFADNVRVKFLLFKNTDAQLPGVVIEHVKFCDRFGQSAYGNGRYVPMKGASCSCEIEIPVAKEPYFAQARIEIAVLTPAGIKFVVTFLCETHINPKCTFLSGVVSEMTFTEKEHWHKALAKHTGADAKPPVPDGNGENRPRPAAAHHLLEYFRKAVFTEMYFLKSNGGRKYKVTKGKFISKIETQYAYQFELESELYIADDSPVTVSCLGRTADGTVMLCEGFEIILLLESDLGKDVGSGTISVEPWKLLEALNKRIETISDLGPIAQKLLVQGRTLATKLPSTQIPKGQEIAKQRAQTQDITLIWGPPGTGKTHTMSEIAISFLQAGKTVLLVSHSNVSVDGVAAKIAELLRAKGMNRYLETGHVLRYGYIRDERLSQDPHVSAYNFALGKSPSYRKEMESLTKDKEKLKARKGPHDPEVILVEKKLKDVRKKIRLEERKYVEKARIVATTVSKIYVDALFADRKYDVVMFDEASMAYVPQIICAATFAGERFICVGDFKQLSPIAQSSAKEILNKDIFSYFGISDGLGRIYAHPWLVMLNEQRRMHPGISAFANRVVYEKLLRNHDSVRTNRNTIVGRSPLPGHAMSLLDLTGTYCATGKNSDNSRFNVLSAVLAFGTALTAEANGEESVGIITPYAAQTRLVRAMIQDHRKKAESATTCATVHQFQGSERNVVIFDAVESYPSTKPGWLMSKNDNGSVTRLVNVAVTRARGKLIAVANRGYWVNRFGDTEHTFFKLIQHLIQSGSVVGVKDQMMQRYVESLCFGNDIQVFTARDEAYARFASDVGKSRKSVLVSIPGTPSFGEFEDRIYSLLDGARANQIRLMIKASKSSLLPAKWRSHASDCDNAILPTVLVDDKVLWYGFLQGDGKFVDGKRAFVTVFPLWIRFSGEHTVEMIKSLAALDMCSRNGTLLPLVNKVPGRKETAGLGAYISRTEKCCQCGNPMALGRSKNNKTILRCTNCSNTSLLDVRSVNYYLQQYGVVCPLCSQRLRAGVSTYGLYVRCQGGHFPKVEEL